MSADGRWDFNLVFKGLKKSIITDHKLYQTGMLCILSVPVFKFLCQRNDIQKIQSYKDSI
jgi:hypothetical protein